MPADRRSPDGPERAEVAIVGGGAAGLFLALRLARRGVDFVVLERLAARRPHSRAIGVHPPSLELLADLGLAGAFVARGVRVRNAVAFGGRGEVLGELSFAGVSRSFPFVLTLPQHEGEALLEDALERQRPGALRRGARVTELRLGPQEHTLVYAEGGRRQALRARFVVGADGARSFVRAAAGFGVREGVYPDAYLMGDFDDTTVFGEAAAVFLHPEGVVESFPLAGGLRRWVVKTPELLNAAKAPDLTARVYERTGLQVPPASNRMLSAFGARWLFARRSVRGRVVLLGDAAHVLSPIGGQGMNLAWLDAAALDEALGAVLRGDANDVRLLSAYDRERRRLARRASRLAELNMLLGRARRRTTARDAVIGALLRPPGAGLLARLYAMRWAGA